MPDSIEESMERIATAFERMALVTNEILTVMELEMVEDGYTRAPNGSWVKDA